MAAPSFDQLLAPLANAAGVVRRPLSQPEIDEIEKRVGLPAPPGVRAWLSVVGLFQDVTSGSNGGFQLHERPDELVASRQFICNLLDESAAGLFPFGHDGAGDEIAVRAGAVGADDELVFIDHETARTRVMGAFSNWLNKVVARALRKSQQPGAQGQKLWCVQFTFLAQSEDAVFKSLESISQVQIPDRQWVHKPTTAAGVKVAQLQFTLDGRAITMGRSSYPSWPNPSFSFDLEEDVLIPPPESMIRKLDTLFQGRQDLGYKLVDYGPIDAKALRAAEGDEAKREAAASRLPLSRPWWKLW